MGIVLLKSKNEGFSHIIGKNPSSGMIIKYLRKGKSYGWYGDEHTYVCYFKDSFNNVSYSKNREDSFEYNDLTRYNSPALVLNILTEFFDSSYKKEHELDVIGYENSIEMVIEIDRFNLINNMFYRMKDVEIEYENMGGTNYKVIIKTCKSLNYLLNFVGVYCLFTAMVNGNYMNITEDMIKKYAESLVKLGATYYMKYLFMLKVIPNKRLFESVKNILEIDSYYDLNLNFGSTQEWRREFVFNNLSYEYDVVDVGCGSGYYTLPLAKRLPENEIIAIDIDEECIDRVSGVSESRGYDNVLTFDSLDSYKKLKGDSEKPLDIILVEVIEHMEKSEAKALIKDVMNLNFNSIFITSPVREFNVHYDLENSIDGKVKNGFRHHDHKWEGTVEEFTSLILDCIEEELVDKDICHGYSHHMIGDTVDGYAPTQGVIITKG